MTDFDTLKAMLDRIQVTYSVVEQEDLFKKLYVEKGYVGFFTFTRDGALTDIGAYE